MSILRRLNCASRLLDFHRNEDGIESIQAVMILAVGGVAMVVLKNKWDHIKDFFERNLAKATEIQR